ncbi:MAG: DUF3467 domain-containing protein [Acidimicrobiia bacterium]|nr:DUF3467 domain-containing protein [Acidimicrobiia bacterium]
MDTSHLEGSAVPEYYTDSVRISVTPYSFVLDFGLSTESPGEQKNVATVRMSPHHAWVLTRALAKHVAEYESSIGSVRLPDEILRDIGLDDTD